MSEVSLFDRATSRDILFKESCKLNPTVESDLCLYTPTETLTAMRRNKKLIAWHYYIETEFLPRRVGSVALFFPCAAFKPWSEERTKSPAYKKLYRLMRASSIKKYITLHTISEPLGVVGEEDYDYMPSYDNPGLFRQYNRRRSLPWDEDDYEGCIEHLSTVIARYLQRIRNLFSLIIFYVEPSSPACDFTQEAIMKSEVDAMIIRRSHFASRRSIGYLLRYISLVYPKGKRQKGLDFYKVLEEKGNFSPPEFLEGRQRDLILSHRALQLVLTLGRHQLRTRGITCRELAGFFHLPPDRTRNLLRLYSSSGIIERDDVPGTRHWILSEECLEWRDQILIPELVNFTASINEIGL